MDQEAPRPGKQTLVEKTFGHTKQPDLYTHTVDAVQRDLRALRTTVLPSFIRALRRTDLEPIARHLEVMRAAHKVQHMLLVADERVRHLEKSQWFEDPMVRWLRANVDGLVAQARRLGAYRGSEHLVPRREEPQRPRTRNAPPMVDLRRAHRVPTMPAPRRGAALEPQPRSAPSRTTSTTAVVQRKAVAPIAAPRDAHQVAARGVATASTRLPHLGAIQRSFGKHDVSSIRTQIGGVAADASRALGAKAYATGSTIAFEHDPDLHTAVHEAVHILQQRAGLAPANGIGESGDRYEQQADEIADLVVAGRNVEGKLDEIVGAGRSPVTAVQRQDAAVGPPTGDMKYAYRRTFESKLGTIAKLGDVVVQMRWEIAMKRDGSLGGGKVGATDAVLERKTKDRTEETTKKLKTSLLKVKDSLLDTRGLDVFANLPPMRVEVEAKFLESDLSLDNLKLDAMKLALVGEADVSTLFPDAVHATMQLRVELSVPADVATALMELAQSKQKLERYAKLQEELGDTKRRIVKLEKTARKRRAAGAPAAELKKIDSDLAAANEHRDKLKRARAGAIKGRDKAIRSIGLVAKKLDGTKVGRVVAKLASKALEKGLRRFIPIYGWLQGAKDLFDIAKFLVTFDWSMLGAGGRGEGSGAEADDDENVDVDAPLDGDVLTEPGPVELTADAERVIQALRAPRGWRGAKAPLDDDAKELINRLVPPDLDAAELEEIDRLLAAGAAPAGDGVSLVEAVVHVLQTVRPSGKRKLRNDAQTAAAARPKDAPRAQHRRSTAPSRDAGSRVIDVRSYLRRNATIDPDRGKVVLAPTLELGGVTFRVVEAKQAHRLFEGVHDVMVTVEVAEPPKRKMLIKGHGVVERGMRITEVFEVPTPVVVRGNAP